MSGGIYREEIGEYTQRNKKVKGKKFANGLAAYIAPDKIIKETPSKQESSKRGVLK